MLNAEDYISLDKECIVDDYITNGLKHHNINTTVMFPVKALAEFYSLFYVFYKHMRINKRFKVMCEQAKNNKDLCVEDSVKTYLLQLAPFIDSCDKFTDIEDYENTYAFLEVIEYFISLHLPTLKRIHTMPNTTVVNISYLEYAYMLDFVEEYYGIKSEDGKILEGLVPEGKILINILINGHNKPYGKPVLSIVN